MTDARLDDLPLPGWAGIPTLFGAAMPNGPRPRGRWNVLGVPFDGTASSRPGACEGPRAVREASVVFSSYLASLGETEMYDCRTQGRFRYQAPALVDHGDAATFPTDVERTYDVVRRRVASVMEGEGNGIFLNGDHSCTYATFSGVKDALDAEKLDARVGFVTIDHHFDFGDESVLHGRIYHGSNSRRIVELEGVHPEDVLFVGMGDVTRFAQLERLRSDGHGVVTMADINRIGVMQAVADPLARLVASCSSVYVSLDIDVLDASVAPGTGHVTIGGLASGELFDLFFALRSLPVRAIDISEVAPRYDPSGRTAQIAARLLFEFLFRQEEVIRE